jgi:mannose-6-phosphate isomerase
LDAAVCGRFADTLPFLVKVLAADEPLSLQAHPSAQQAVEGFGREERQGIPVSSPVRNYRDCSHKPELLVARGQFKALAGFRSGARSVELLRALRVSDLDRSSACCMTSPKPTVCAHCSTTWITAPQQDSMCWCPR